MGTVPSNRLDERLPFMIQIPASGPSRNSPSTDIWLSRLNSSHLCASRMQQFYGFSRALSLGDFGCHGVNADLVKNLMKSLPPLELALILVASEMTSRSGNFLQLAHEAGVWDKLDGYGGKDDQQQITLNL